MLKEIIDAWKSKGLLADLFDRFQTMMEETEEMFDAVYNIIYENKNEESEKKLPSTDAPPSPSEESEKKLPSTEAPPLPSSPAVRPAAASFAPEVSVA